MQRLEALEVPLGECEPGRGLGKGALGLRELSVRLRRLDLEQSLALPHRVPGAHSEGHYGTHGAARDHGLARGLDDTAHLDRFEVAHELDVDGGHGNGLETAGAMMWLVMATSEAQHHGNDRNDSEWTISGVHRDSSML